MCVCSCVCIAMSMLAFVFVIVKFAHARAQRHRINKYSWGRAPSSVHKAASDSMAPRVTSLVSISTASIGNWGSRFAHDCVACSLFEISARQISMRTPIQHAFDDQLVFCLCVCTRWVVRVSGCL